MANEYKVRGIILQPFCSNCLFEGRILHESTLVKGTLEDRWGLSTIEGKIGMGKDLFEETLRFTKKYQDREDIIFYSFKKDPSEALWVGAYQGLATGIGGAQCEFYLIKPAIDWERKLREERLDEEKTEAWSKDILQSMITEGYFEIRKDEETGQEIVMPIRGKRQPRPDNN